MTNWLDFWQNYRRINIFDNSDLLYQVGKTVNGEIISSDAFNEIVASIIRNLSLNVNDNLLDLCCGNGVVTYELSKVVNSIIGIDFSEPFINNAKSYKQRENIQYLLHDILKLSELRDYLSRQKINKVLIYDAFAYFNQPGALRLLEQLDLISNVKKSLLFASVLDRERKKYFYNTTSRKLRYLLYTKLFRREDGLGHWWKKSEIIEIAEKYFYKWEFIEQKPILHTSHYRFDVLLMEKDR